MFILGSFDGNKVDDNSRTVAASERDEEPRRPSSCRDEESPSRGRGKRSSPPSAASPSRAIPQVLPLPPDRSCPVEQASYEGSSCRIFSPSRSARNNALSATEESCSTGHQPGSRSHSHSYYSTFESSHCPASAAAAKPPISEAPSPYPRPEWNASNTLPRNEGRNGFAGEGSNESTRTARTDPWSVMERIRRLFRSRSNASKESRCNDDLSCLFFVATTVALTKDRSWRRSVRAGTRVAIVAAAVCAGTAWILHAFAPASDEGRFDGWTPHERGGELVWRWDRNVYHPQPPSQPLAPTRLANESDRTFVSSIAHDKASAERERIPSHSEAEGHQARRRNLLVVQIGAAPDDESSNLAEPRDLSLSSYDDSSEPPWLEISSRPNRAYAKQWGVDYARIDTPPSAVEVKAKQWLWPWNRPHDEARRRDEGLSRRRSQFAWDVISVLQTLLDRQETQYQEEPFGDMTHGEPQGQSDDLAVTYDSIILIPNNAVIIDLDYDLLRFIPEDKLAAVSWQRQGKGEGFDEMDGGHEDFHAMALQETLLVFNLQHPYARPVANMWSDLALGMSSVTTREQAARQGCTASIERRGCAQTEDVRLLLQAIQNVELERNDEPSSLVLNLTQSSDGFVGRDDDNPHAIKSIAVYPTLLGSLAFKSNSTDVSMSGSPSPSVMSAAFALQTAADSVCYRYYPKCEVL